MFREDIMLIAPQDKKSIVMKNEETSWILIH